MKTRAAGRSGLISFITLAAVTATLFVARDVIIPIALSVLLAFLLARPVSRLERRGVGRVSSVLIVVTAAFLVIGSVGYVVGQQVVSLAGNLDQYQAEIKQKVRSLKGTGSGLGQTLDKFSKEIRSASESPATQARPATQNSAGVVDGATSDISADPVAAAAREVVKGPPATAPSAPGSTPANPIYTVYQSQPESPVQTLLTYLGVIAGPLGTIGLVVVFVVFILLEREALRDRFIAVISHGNYTVTTRAINDAADRISRYLVAQSIVNGSYGLTIGVGLFFIGLVYGQFASDAHREMVGYIFPSFVLWGLLCGVLRFIPYVGPAVSSVFPVVLALAVYPGFGVAIAVISLFIVVELISNNVMEPWLYGASTGLSTVAILVAAVFWTWLWGPVGLLMATPLTVCIAVIGKYVAPLHYLHVLLGDEEGLPPAVAYYQRLLAGARVDAERVVRRVARDQGVHCVADVVYLPALKMARRDRATSELTADDESRIFDDTLAILRPPGVVADLTSTEDIPAAVPIDRPLVLACPAHHRADEVTLHLLGESMAAEGVRTTVLSTRSLPADVEAAVVRMKPAVVLIGVMPPGGLPQARYLCRRLRKRFPDLHILVGYWGRSKNFDRLLVGLRKAGASYVLTSIGQTRSQISAMLPKPPDTVLMDEPESNIS